MDNAGLMRGSQSIGYLCTVTDCVVGLQGTAEKEDIHRRAVDVLHDNEIDSVFRADVINGNDIRVIQRRCGLRLLKKTASRIGDRGLCRDGAL